MLTLSTPTRASALVRMRRAEMASCSDGQEECDNAQSNSDSAVCTASCVAAVCGDGLVLQWEEECDNAGLNSDDAMCTANCAAAVCGDGLVWLGTEDCDAGMANGPGNACTDECLANVCGDGVLGPGEGCDDGNGIDGDECTNACAPATCGDAILAQGESCDDGNAVDTDVCLSTCAMASCGDGFVFGGHEECDNAEFNSDNAMCTAGCVAAVCGDGLVWLGSEACDDANMAEFDLCTTQCFEQAPPELQLSFSQVKEFDFSWAPVFGAAYYQLWESRDGNQNFSQVGGNIVGESFTLAVPLHFRVNSSYKLLACNEEGCLESENRGCSGDAGECSRILQGFEYWRERPLRVQRRAVGRRDYTRRRCPRGSQRCDGRERQSGRQLRSCRRCRLCVPTHWWKLDATGLPQGL